MKYLRAKSQSQTRLNLLLLSCNIKSDNIKGALSDHLVKGISKTMAAAFNNVPQGNLTRALKTLEKQAKIFEKLKEHDWSIKK
jgi:hypothetical protein